MCRIIVYFCFAIIPIAAIGNDADLIWYDQTGAENHHRAHQPPSSGLTQTRKIKLNQKFPILWQVQFNATFQNLEELTVEDCGVKKIEPNAFHNLRPLTNLSIVRNEIREIKENVFNFVAVRNLNLSHNHVQVISGNAFDHMPVVESIILDFNELRHWNPDWFFNCTLLRSVSIMYNFLEHLPARAFKSLSGNGMSLHFDYNKIGTIHKDVFDGAGNFTVLSLDWNEIQKLDGHTFSRLKSVEKLSLNGDTLRCLSEEFIKSALPKMKHVSVLENPLKCDCLKELQKREGRIIARIEYNKQTVDCDQ